MGPYIAMLLVWSSVLEFCILLEIRAQTFIESATEGGLRGDISHRCIMSQGDKIPSEICPRDVIY